MERENEKPREEQKVVIAPTSLGQKRTGKASRELIQQLAKASTVDSRRSHRLVGQCKPFPELEYS